MSESEINPNPDQSQRVSLNTLTRKLDEEQQWESPRPAHITLTSLLWL